jgi:NAD(P)-dependent dehydrogenase (short-subunit alcohol dehydrogenase family)
MPVLEAVVEEIKAQGGIARAIQCDVSDEKQVQRMVAGAVDAYGHLDILVNNHAGGRGDGPVASMDLGGWNESIAIILTGTMISCREALKFMIPRRTGSIVNISSLAGMYGVPNLSPYGVSKWGVIGLTETLSIEVGPYNIRVNAVSPGATKTDRFEDPQKASAKARGITYEDSMRQFLEHYSLGRIAQPSELAAAILFLASDEASAITGQNLVVDCGWHSLHP